MSAATSHREVLKDPIEANVYINYSGKPIHPIVRQTHTTTIKRQIVHQLFEQTLDQLLVQTYTPTTMANIYTNYSGKHKINYLDK